MNMKRMTALLKRELRDIMRDKKTLVMMVVVPIILYPLLILGMAFLMNAIVSSQAEKTYLAAFDVNEKAGERLLSILESQSEEIGYTVQIVESKDYEADLEQKLIDVYVKEEEDGTFSLYYLSASDQSATALSAIRTLFSLYKDELTEEIIADAGLDADALLNPIQYENKDLSSVEESMGNIIGSIMPFFIVTSILLGAIYPAIDVTAGEKERGTLETLLTLPVTNFEMIMSKFLAVSVIAGVSAFLNVFSMGGAMIFFVSSSLSQIANLDISIRFETFIPGILFTLVVMIFFALLVTAVCMCTCVFAKSFKEANNYITPVMLVFMFGSYAAMIPDLELSARTAAVPVVNVALLIEGLFKFQYDYGLFAVVLFSNVAYSLLAVMILGKIYNSEAILFSESLSSVKLFKSRRDMDKKQMPGLGDVILILCIVLLLMFYVGTYAQLKWGFGGVFVQQFMILIAPLLYAWYMKADKKKLFSLEKVKPLQLLGALLFGIGAFLSGLIAGAILTPIFPESAQNLTQLDEMITGVPVGILILVMAVMPAIGEELLFRGFVMGTLKNRCRPAVAVGVTAVIFAAYHMSLLRFFTVGIIGLGLTIAAYRTGSIAASMTVHFLNNLTSVLISVYPKQMEKALPILFKESLSLSDILLLAGAIIFGIGIGWMLMNKKSLHS